MKCKPEASNAQIAEVFAALADLKDTIPGILAFEGGEDNSVEEKNQGYTHGFTMDFADEQVRDIYLPHPEHQKVVAKIRNIIDRSSESVLVMDFDIEDTETYDVYQTS
jgi:hypothetical protein